MPKIVFNPPLKPDDFRELELIVCPNCGSESVYANTLVSGFTFVNLNTCELYEQPVECDCSIDRAREENDRYCANCKHEWEVEGE
jgi:hypothetical protein